MPKYIKELTLDISGKRNNQTITAKQGDNKSRLIRITLVDGETKVTLEQGENVDFRCLKPDKKSCKLPTTIEEGGTILVELDDNALAVAGLVRADVEINNDDGLALSSTTFYIQVEPSADNGVHIPSTSNQKMARSLDMDGHSIQNLPVPTENGDAVNKEYVDSLQSDMNVNDESNPAFIKNRTHYKEEIKRDYTVFPNVEPDPNLGFVSVGRKVGLEIGKEYTVDVYLTDGTLAQTLQGVATEFPPDELNGLEGVACLQSNLATLVDGVDIDLTVGSPYLTDNAFYVIESDAIGKIIVQGLSSVETVFHKIPSEYVDIPKVEVDKAFNSKSENAQSGIAVEQAINEYDKSLMIGTEKIVDGAVSEEKIGDGTLSQAVLKDKTITASKIADRAITADKLALFSVTETVIANKAIKKRHISEKILDGTEQMDYETPILLTTTQDVVAITNGLLCITENLRKGIIGFEIFSTDQESVEQEIVIGLSGADGIIIDELLRESFDCSNGKPVKFEVFLEQFQNTYLIGEVSAISSSKKITVPIETKEYANTSRSKLPYVHIEFNDKLNQQIAKGSKYWGIRQKAPYTA